MNDDFSYSDQPYIGEVLRLAQTYIGKPGVYHLVVTHDDFCPILSGTGLCICRPTVRRPNRNERRRLAKQVHP